MAGRAAILGGCAAASFAEAKNGAAVDGEILFALARIGVRTADEGAGDVHEVAVGPVVAFEQGPEGDNGGVHFAVRPGARCIGSHRLADGEPFGRVFELLSSVGVAGTPEGLNGGGLVSETALNNAQPGKVAFFGVGIESDGRVVPRAMSFEMNGGVEPIAPALDSLAG